MKFNLEKIIKIETKEDLKNFNINKPIFYQNYLFHYLIILNKLEIIKMLDFPVFKMNEDGLNGFMLAAKYDNIHILKYLLKKYPQYAQNHNDEGLHFINYISNPSKIISIMKEFDNIDWYYLFKFKNEDDTFFYSYFVSILHFGDLRFFVEKYTNFPKYYILKGILRNEKLSNKQKIDIFDKFTIQEINEKGIENYGLFCDVIEVQDIDLTKYFLTRKIDLDYIIRPSTHFITPFNILYTRINLSFSKNLEKILELSWDTFKKVIDLNHVTKYGVSYLESVLSIDNQNNIKILDKINDYIMKNSPDSIWNRIYSKKNNLFYIINKPFKTYHKYLDGRELDITVKTNENKTIIDIANSEWKEYLLKAKKYKPDTNIKLEINTYQHHTQFTSTLLDIMMYFIYLDKKYKNLYIPKIFEPEFENRDFPWLISYAEPDNALIIHPKLNFLINNIRRNKSHDFATVFLSLSLSENLKHANIIIYDFNRLTIERFEPYGDDGIHDILDDYLEEELTWNTGFTYLRPKDFMTKPGYQLISDEGYTSLKPGDFGGFCLGWCLWYLEHRIRNEKVDPKTLNQKTIEKLLRLDDSFTEYIRNYSDKLFKMKKLIGKKIKVSEKNLSNINLSKEDENKIIMYAENYFGVNN
jgi:hypothetical protein